MKKLLVELLIVTIKYLIKEQEEARHVDEVIDRVASRNYKVPNLKGSGMSWKEYELKEKNEEQGQETDYS